MRIMFLTHRLPYPPNKGDKIRSFWELQSFARGHEVDLFCFYDDAEDEKWIPAVRRFCRECHAEPLPWLRSRMQALIAAATGRPFTLGYFYSRTMAERVSHALASRKYDLIFVFCTAMAQYVEHAEDVPRILDMVDVDSDKWAQYARRALPPAAWLWGREAERLGGYEGRIAREFSATLLCSEGEAGILRERGANGKIHVVAHMLDTDYLNPARIEVPAEIAAWQPYIVFTGSMDYLPNADAAKYFCREVLPRMRAQLPEARFVIAGRNPARSLRKLAANPAVCVTGSVPDIRPYLRGASAAVAPLHTARGVQNKVLEAMAMGLPVMASSKPAAALPRGLAAHLLVEDDPQRMAARLVDVMRHGPRPPLEWIRRAVLAHYSGLALQQQLESILHWAAERAGHGRPEITIPAASGNRPSLSEHGS